MKVLKFIKMKSYIITLFLLLSTAANLHCSLAATEAEAQAVEKQASEACSKEINLNADEMARIAKGFHQATGDKSAASQNFKCYVECVYKKIGIIAADGKQNLATITKYIEFLAKDKSKVADILSKCSKPKGDTSCDKVFDFETCLLAQTGN